MGIADDRVICHCEVPIEPSAGLRHQDQIRGDLAFDRLADRGGSAMLSVTDNSRGRAVIPRYIVSLRRIARPIAIGRPDVGSVRSEHWRVVSDHGASVAQPISGAKLS